MLTNGCANIFYVKLNDMRVVAVDVDWSAGDRDWCLRAHGSDGYRWRDRYCVFSRC